jgi:putative transposase
MEQEKSLLIAKKEESIKVFLNGSRIPSCGCSTMTHMAFQRHPIQHSAIMFITTNIQGREPVFAVPEYANEAVITLYKTQQISPFFLYGFVIMPDHVHLLLSIPEGGSISKVMHTFKRGSAFAIDQWPIWQSRFHLILPKEPIHALRYIHSNPVKAGIVLYEYDYPWSSASGKWDVTPLEVRL